MKHTAERDYAKYMARGSAITFVVMVATAMVVFGLRVLLARSLSPEDYGLLFSIIALVSFFSVFRHLGLDIAVAKFLPEFRAKKRLDDIKSTISTALVLQTVMAILISLALIVLSEWLSRSFFDTPAARPIIIIMSVWFLVMVSERFLKGIFRGFQDMMRRSGVELFRMMFTFGLVAAVIFLVGPDLVGIALAYTFGAIFTTALLYMLLQRKYSSLLERRGSITKSLAKKLLTFGLPLILVGVSGKVIGYMNTLTITAFRPLADVGFYQVAHPTAHLLLYVGTALSTPLLPMVAELWAKKGRETLRSTLHFLAKFTLIFVIPIALILLAFPEIVIRLLFGGGYLGAATALQILSVGMVFMAGASILGAILIGTGHPTLQLKAIGAAAVFNFLANLLLVPPYGVEGAAIATSASFLIALVLSIYYVRKIIRFPVPIAAIFKTLVGGGLTLLVIWGLKSIVFLPPWLALFAVIIPSLLFYVVWICRTGAVTMGDIDLLDRVVPVPKRLIGALKRLTSK